MKIRSALGFVLVAVSCFVPSGQVARAVTYGDPVFNPAAEFPEVVPVFIGSDSLCTGTLIQQQIVLTAAHCVYGVDQSISVGVNRKTLFDGGSIQVDASWYHPRYDSITGQNDIAVLHLVKPAGVSQLASLPKYSKNFTANKFLLLGWGDDQNGQLTNGLNRLSLVNQLSSSKKVFGNRFNQKTMIGAGRYFPDEAIYGGGCNGDSGGPLYKGEFGSGKVVVGITSFGRTGCNTKAPTIFTKVSYYVAELQRAIGIVNAKSADQGRAKTQNPPPGSAPPVQKTIPITSPDHIWPLKFSHTSAGPSSQTGDGFWGRVQVGDSFSITKLCVTVKMDEIENSNWTSYYPHWSKTENNCMTYVGQKFFSYLFGILVSNPPGVQAWTASIIAYDSNGRTASVQLTASM